MKTQARPHATSFGAVQALLVIDLPKLDGTAQRSMLPLVMFPVMVAGVALT
jgi:hypothetical protein